MSLLVGVDGGSAGCSVAVLDTETGRRLDVEGGPADAAGDLSGTIWNLRTALDKAASLWGEPLGNACAYFGISGVHSREISYAIITEFAFARIKVTDDRPTALAGYLDGQDGFLIVVDTGLIAARSHAGAHRFVGGHGFTLSNHGSGAWMGRALLDLSLRCHDGLLKHSPVTQAVMDRFAANAAAIAGFAREAGPADYATFAPLVLEAARGEDPHAARIITEGAGHLCSALAALGFRRGGPLCLAGEIGPHYVGFLKAAYLDNLILPEGTALDGALYLAADLYRGGR